jgi:3-oxoadipate enol-lactonase
MPITDNGEVRIYYELSGSGAELLVLSNSLGSSLRMWDKVVPALEAHHRVLRYDTRGHGASNVPTPPYTLDQLGSDVLFLLDHVGADRVNFCGLSLGGLTGQWLGIHAPQRLGRLVLANTAARIGTHEMWDQRIATAKGAGMEALAPAIVERWFTLQYRERHPLEMEIIRGMIGSIDPDGYAGCCGVLRAADLRGEIASIAAPCLVITGKHDPATPASDGRALSAALRDAQYVELDSSHLSAWEVADEFADAVLAFLPMGEHRHG